MNLASIADWSTELPLTDVFKASRPWVLKGPGKLAYDQKGNPLLEAGQSAETLMVREIDGHYPAGNYVATYEGTGKAEMRRWDVKKVVREQPGRIESEVVPGDGGIELAITASNPKDPVRNIHVWMPGSEKAPSPFNKVFLERLEPFGVLRFMDWQRTNHSPLKQWAQRAQLSDARYSTEAGMPLELLIDLANTRHSDPWFCMPHQADDDFVREFAQLVKGRLDPERKVYVEYSNEVWNGAFTQSRWAQEQGQKLKLGDPPGFRFYAQRSVEVFTIWEKVFGDSKRLVRVLGSQFANPWVSEQILTWQDAGKHADALAVAPYFGYSYGDPKTAEEVGKMSVDKLLDRLAEEIDGSNKEVLEKQAALARKYQLQLVAYEGGQHLAGFAGAENNQALTNLFLAANRHPRMGELYKKHLTHWFAGGGGLYVVFNDVGKPGKWGSWGVLEYQDQPADKAPKYQAIVDFAKQTPPPKQ